MLKMETSPFIKSYRSILEYHKYYSECQILSLSYYVFSCDRGWDETESESERKKETQRVHKQMSPCLEGDQKTETEEYGRFFQQIESQ